MDNTDKVAQVMNEWYDAMEKNKIMVQPKASTILGIILSKYLSDGVRDVWAEALTIKGGEFASWYASLSKEEQLEYDMGRQRASAKHDPRNKSLLKG